MKRNEHLFQFKGEDISKAALAEANYHEERLKFWREELNESIEKVKATAKIVVKEQQVTGGKRLDLQIDYGDMSAYRRMNEAQGKIDRHRSEMERFQSDARLYGSQKDRFYELDADDAAHLRIATNREREE